MKDKRQFALVEKEVEDRGQEQPLPVSLQLSQDRECGGA